PRWSEIRRLGADNQPHGRFTSTVPRTSFVCCRVAKVQQQRSFTPAWQRTMRGCESIAQHDRGADALSAGMTICQRKWLIPGNACTSNLCPNEIRSEEHTSELQS